MVEEKAHLTPTISHRAYVLKNGYIVLEGNGKDLLVDDKVKKTYLGF